MRIRDALAQLQKEPNIAVTIAKASAVNLHSPADAGMRSVLPGKQWVERSSCSKHLVADFSGTPTKL